MDVVDRILKLLNRELALAEEELYRMRSQTANYTDTQMKEQYGDSGYTCMEILQNCAYKVNDINACIAWVNRQ